MYLMQRESWFSILWAHCSSSEAYLVVWIAMGTFVAGHSCLFHCTKYNGMAIRIKGRDRGRTRVTDKKAVLKSTGNDLRDSYSLYLEEATNDIGDHKQHNSNAHCGEYKDSKPAEGSGQRR
ncbi:hypothetical protein PaecuDRAFT_2251 [Paenibacillus curdlanolyticus YK9]|uniref:Uncharacterized protein n=1 Tax=Paenibacillus curdlanolyticus YK9 TaxID=717606 RepID=E0I9B4_9BACL|nr:hypothetical protein PaecuDRAFT_2251 [Paenibacillus curdlanolyticus YK9]